MLLQSFIRGPKGNSTEWYDGTKFGVLNFEWIDATENNYQAFKVRTDRDNYIKEMNKLPNKIGLFRNIPFNVNYSFWGDKIGVDRYNIIYFDKNIKEMYIENINNYISIVTILYLSGEELVFQDRRMIKNNYIRNYDNKFIYHFNNFGAYFYSESINVLNKIKELKPSPRLNNSMATIDIETYLDSNNINRIYCICMYDGATNLKYFISDFINSKEMILKFIKDITIPKYNGYTFYFHNGSKFDLIFLLKDILSLVNDDFQINPLYKDGKFLNLEIKFNENNNQYSFNIKDSILLLNSSLTKDKAIFPYNLIKENNLDYVGKVPLYKYFDSKKVNEAQYNEYIKDRSIWNLRIESLNYCLNDCIVLYNILIKFS